MNNNTNNTAAQETTAIVPANNTLSTTVQQPVAPAPADTEIIETTFTDDKEQAPAAAPADEKKKTKKHRNVEHCKVDFDKKKIIITKEFAKQASIIDTPEFNRLSDLYRGYPNFKVITRTAKKSTTRPSMKGLTKDFMETHISIRYPNDWTLYQNQMANSKAFKSPYMYMRKWFTERYPDWATYKVLPDAAATT